MVVVPIPNYAKESRVEPASQQEERSNLIGLAAGGTLIAGGLLLLAGRHRSGTVAAVSGAALTLLNQQDTLSSWWHSLPNYIDEVQRVLTQVQDAVNDVAAKRETLRRILAR